MLCRSCQTLNPDKSSRCQNCGGPLVRELALGDSFVPAGLTSPETAFSQSGKARFRLVYLLPLVTAMVTVGVVELWLAGLGKPSMVVSFPFIGVFVMLFFTAALVGDYPVLATCDRLGDKVASRTDLLRLKPAITRNMQVAIASLVTLLSVIGSLVADVQGVREISSQIIGLACYFPPAVMYGLVFGWWFNPRRRVKRIQLASDDPEVARLHQLWLKQWLQLRWKLPS
ncbi:MAG: hypothetical protein K1Y36_25280 [Blastocatellia bacterium]|nr:hypothetical protein [Blastocatellia bacterium]